MTRLKFDAALGFAGFEFVCPKCGLRIESGSRDACEWLATQHYCPPPHPRSIESSTIPEIAELLKPRGRA